MIQKQIVKVVVHYSDGTVEEKNTVNSPFFPSPLKALSDNCSQCGITLLDTMCYSCPRQNCPCGLGTTWS